MDQRSDEERGSELEQQRRREERSAHRKLEIQQLLEVDPDPELEDGFTSMGLKLKGELKCEERVQSGNRLTVSVANADGNVIAQGELRAGYPTHHDITDRGQVIGLHRRNHAKVVD